MALGARRRILVAGAMAALVGASLVSAAHAAGPSGWRQLSSFPAGASYPGMRNIDQPTVARLGAGLQVVWPVSVTSGSQAYHATVLDASGAVVGPAAPIIADWASLTEDPRLLTVAGQQFLSFSGLRSTNTAEPYTTGAAYSAKSADGVTWALNPGSMSATTNAYADYGMDAVDAAGTPVWAANAGSTAGITWHAGTSASEPAPAGSDGQFLLGGCCGYDAALARDEASGAIYAAFYSNSDTAAEQGVQVGRILPTTSAFTRAPSSVTAFGGRTASLSPDQRIAMVGRPGGGVLVAYKSGYPSTRSVKVWQVGTAKPLTIPGSAGAARVAMATGPDGVVWVAWTTSSKVKVVRVKDGKVLPRSTVALARPPKTSDLWHIAASSGAAKRLDLVITATGPGSSIQVYARQVRAR